jgi:tRNA wybutosine-synthesizing protein 3
LHVEADSEEAAHELLGLANVIGYQNSGITPSKTRHMLAIRSTHKLDVPIAAVDPTTQRIHLLVDTTYLYVLLRLSNQKFTQNIDRMKKFEQAVETQLLVKDQMETKEQRRERKRREGLERQKAAGKQDDARDTAVMDMYDDVDEPGNSSTANENNSANRGQALMDLYEGIENI